MIQQVPRAAVSALRSLGADSDCFATSETSESGADLICVYDLGAGIGAHGMAPITVYKVRTNSVNVGGQSQPDLRV